MAVWELRDLRDRRDSLLTELLKRDSEDLNLSRSALVVTCNDLIENGRASAAVQYLDTYLADHPDALTLATLRLQAT